MYLRVTAAQFHEKDLSIYFVNFGQLPYLRGGKFAAAATPS